MTTCRCGDHDPIGLLLTKALTPKASLSRKWRNVYPPEGSPPEEALGRALYRKFAGQLKHALSEIQNMDLRRIDLEREIIHACGQALAMLKLRNEDAKRYYLAAPIPVRDVRDRWKAFVDMLTTLSPDRKTRLKERLSVLKADTRVWKAVGDEGDLNSWRLANGQTAIAGAVDFASTETLADILRPAMIAAANVNGQRMAAVLGVSFNLKDQDALDWLNTYTYRLSARTAHGFEDAIKREVFHSIDDSFGPKELVSRIRQSINPLDAAGQPKPENRLKYEAQRIARTETHRAHVLGAVELAREEGAHWMIWITAGINGRTGRGVCWRCAPMNGRLIPTDLALVGVRKEYPGLIPVHPFCLLPGTQVVPLDVIGGFRTWYDGMAVEVAFADGGRLTVTENHQLLTRAGFAAAKTLNPGDDVLYCPDLERVVTADVDHYRQPTGIEEIVGALAESSGMTTRRVPVAPEYLHGDGVFAKGHIDVIASDSLLRNCSESPLMEHSYTSLLNAGAGLSTSFVGQCDLSTMLFALRCAAEGSMGGGSTGLSSFSGHQGHRDAIGCAAVADRHASPLQSAGDDITRNTQRSGKCQHGFASCISRDHIGAVNGQTQATTSDLNAVLTQDANNALVSDTLLLSKSIERFPGLIAERKIVDVRTYPFAGHVYDLQTVSGLYIANGVLSSNCRCVLSPVTRPDDVERKQILTEEQVTDFRSSVADSDPSLHPFSSEASVVAVSTREQQNRLRRLDTINRRLRTKGGASGEKRKELQEQRRKLKAESAAHLEQRLRAFQQH